MFKTEVYKMSFLIVKCFNCGQVQTQEKRSKIINLTFKCHYCNKSRVFHNKRTGRLNIIIYDDYVSPVDASLACTKYKALIQK